jgi:hypothetical protein
MQSNTNSNTPQLPTLYALCDLTQKEIVALSGLTEDALADAYSELCNHLHTWASDYDGPFLNDPYVCFCQMLQDWKSPWPFMDESCLNGLTFAQFHLAWAYGQSEIALETLTQRPKKGTGMSFGLDADDAACFAVYAAKGLTHAKQLIALGQDRLAQKARRRKVA